MLQGRFLDDPGLPSAPRTSFGDVFRAGREATIVDGLTLSRIDTIDEAYDRRIDAIREATGVDMVHPRRAFETVPDETGGTIGPAHDPYVDFDRELAAIARNFPQARDIIRPDRSPREDAYERHRATERAAGEALINYRGVPGTGTLALLAGGVAAQVYDPANLGASFIGAPGRAGLGLRGIAWMAVKQGAVNAAVETGLQPFIAQWRKESGLDYTASSFAMNVGAAFVFGAGLDAGLRGGYRAIQRGRGNTPRLDADGNVEAWRTPEQALDDAARVSKNETLRKAWEGDTAALRKVAEETGAIERPEVRGILDELETSEGLPTRVEGVDDGETLARIVQALRHADDPDVHPPPVAVEPVPPARGLRLDDGTPAPGRVAEIDGRPVTFRSVELKETVTDAATFQFKGGGDAAGSTGRLSGVEKWDPVAAGRAVIYERADGTLVVADAHQRRSLAVRLKDQDTTVEAVVFREADGWTAADVRALAAKKNLQEGSGSVVDAAMIMRERPDIVDGSVPLGTEAMRQARSLARLSDEAFGQVVGGVLPANQAALVADLMPDKSRHAGLVAELAQMEPANALQARLMLNELVQAPVLAEEQMTLFGVMTMERALLRERVGVLASALKSLGQDQRIFRMLQREAGRIEDAGNRLASDTNAQRAAEATIVSELIEQLATQRGLVSSWLDDAARAVAQGQPKARAASAFVRRVTETLEREGLDGLARAPEPELTRARLDDLSGPEAQAQVDALDAELADAIAVAEGRADPAAEGQASLFAFADPGQWRHTGRAADDMPEIRAAVDQVVARLPAGVKARVEDRLVFGSQEIDGRYDLHDAAVYVSLSAADPVRVARHEEVHALRALGLFDAAEWNALTAAVERFDLRRAYDIDGRYGAAYKKQFGPEAEGRLVEEAVAEMIADHAAGRRFGGVVDRLIERVRQFVSDIASALGIQGYRTVDDVFRAIERGDVAARAAVRDVALPGGATVRGLHLFAIRAFHGSPHDFDRFDMSKIGTGEGAQAYGHGLYFAENEGVARSYQEALAKRQPVTSGGSPVNWHNKAIQAADLVDRIGDRQKAIEFAEKMLSEKEALAVKSGASPERIARHLAPDRERLAILKSGDALPDVNRPTGRMYEVRINAEPEQFLDWEKPLSQQSEAVRAVLTESDLIDAAVDGGIMGPDFDVDGPLGPILAGHTGAAGRQSSRSLYDKLKSNGVAGIRYLDAGSRTAGEGSRNYVVFDDSLIEIVAKDGQTVTNFAAARADAARATDLQDAVEACRL